MNPSLNETVSPVSGPLTADLTVPGDKSISHRLLILGALAEGLTEITGLSDSHDVLSTSRCLRQLGVDIEVKKTGHILVRGAGPTLLRPSLTPLDCGNSGTTLRLLMGLLASRPFSTTQA